MKKILEWNINGRSRTTRSDFVVSKFVFDHILKVNPDAFILTEFVKLSNETLIKLLSRSYSLVFNGAECNNGVLIGFKKNFEMIRNLNSFIVKNENNKIVPNLSLIELKDKLNNLNFVFGGVRIRIGGDDNLYQDFKARREQLKFLIDNLKAIDCSKFLVLGDFNNGWYKASDNENSFIGRPREFYSYPYITDAMEKIGFKVTTPEEGGSWSAFRLDHALSKNIDVANSRYKFEYPVPVHSISFYPDHAQLILNIKEGEI